MMSSLIIHHFQSRGRRGPTPSQPQKSFHFSDLSHFSHSAFSGRSRAFNSLPRAVSAGFGGPNSLPIPETNETKNGREIWRRIERRLEDFCVLCSYPLPPLAQPSRNFNPQHGTSGWVREAKSFPSDGWRVKIFPSSVSEWMKWTLAQKREEKAKIFGCSFDMNYELNEFHSARPPDRTVRTFPRKKINHLQPPSASPVSVYVF